MSTTRVLPEEYASLTMVPRNNWNRYGSWESPIHAPCDIHPDRNMTQFMQTEDHRAIALCHECYQRVLKAKRRA